jgi:DNA-binding XRE family transcriptional regulator
MVCDMVAAESELERDTNATRSSIALREELFDKLTAKLGAVNEIQRATLIGVDRATIHRMRRRLFTPSFDVAMRMAEVLGTTVDELFERVS